MPQSSHFDVFLCHNSQDKPEVIKIAEKLKQQGVKPWLDVWELRPGLPWQPELERHIEQIKSAAVFVGESGIGPWQEMEIQAYLRRFVKKGSPVIPILLSNAPAKPQLPIFLEGMTWVDFRGPYIDPIKQFIWGITGIKPSDYRPPNPPQKEVVQERSQEDTKAKTQGKSTSGSERITPVDQSPKTASPIKPQRTSFPSPSAVNLVRRSSQPIHQSSTYPSLNRRKILQWIGWGGAGLGAAGLYQLVNQSVTNQPKPQVNQPIVNQTEPPKNQPKPLENIPNASTEKRLSDSKVEFQVLTVNDRGEEESRETVQAEFITEELDNGINFDIVPIPGGTFTMGAPASSEEKSDNDERPQRKVKIPDFYMGKFQITQKLWQAVANLQKVNRELDPDPSFFKGDDRPVERVSWYDAEEFCLRLSQKTQQQYRLPSEAEWEYACRAGTKTPFYFGQTITTELVNFNGNYTYAEALQGKYLEETTPVGQFPPNRFGLYDMHGNVYEWCADTWHNSYQDAPTDGSAWISKNDSRILRGGSWNSYPWYCRSADRLGFDPDSRHSFIGFRVVCRFPRS